MKKKSSVLINICLVGSLFFLPVLVSAQTPGFAISQRNVFGGSNDDFISKIIPTSDGGYLLAGQSNSNNNDIIGYHGSWDIWVVKVNHNWQKQWSQCYGGSSKDDFKDITQMADGTILLFGWTTSNDGDFTDYHGNVDAFVIKLSAQGTVLAKKSFGGSSSETNNLNFKTETDGSVYLAISTSSNDGDVSGNHGESDFWVLKLNPDLSIAWSKCYGGSGDDTPTEIIKTKDGNLLVCGGTYSNDGDVTGLHGSKADFWIIKLSQTGSILWQKVLGGTENDFATCMTESSAGDYIIGGQTYSNNGDVTGLHGNSADGWVCNLTSSGTLKWNKSYGGSSVETIYSIKSINGVDFILESPTYSTDGDVIGGHPSPNNEADVWILRINGNNGVIVWQKSLGGSLTEDYSDMNVNSNGAVTVLMASTSNDGDLAGIDGYRKASGWLVKLNNFGSIDQQLRFGSFPGGLNNSSEGNSLYIVPGVNSMIVAGTNKFQDPSTIVDDITISKGGIDGMLIRVGDFNIIKSKPFRDRNKNNIRDGNEPFVVSGIQLSTSKVGDSMVVFYKNNFFTSIVDTGRYLHKLISSRYSADSGIRNSVFTSYNTTDSFEFAVQPILSRISGYVFIDKNYNGIKDTTEPYASNVLVVSKRGNDSTTNLLKNGFYYNLIDTGLYTTKIYIQSDEYTILPDSALTNVVDYNQDYSVNFALRPFLNIVKGSAFYDRNSNGIKDISEPMANGLMVKTEKNGSFVEGTSNEGIFKNVVDTGIYRTTISGSNMIYYSSMPAFKQSVFLNYRSEDSVVFALQPIPGKRDIKAAIFPLTPARRFRTATYQLQCVNIGTDTLLNKIIRLIKDIRTNFVDAIPGQSAINGDTVFWNINRLLPGESTDILINLNVNGTVTSLGDTLVHVAIVDTTGDINNINNSSVLRQIILGPYDPNDKTENNAGYLYKLDYDSGKALSYTIRFQNTGNDTAFTVIVRDTIDTKLDNNSIEMIGASNPFGFTLKNGRYCTWIFNNIKLVDSNRNEPLSHGYISYRIKPKAGLFVGDTIRNSASIYFDFNLPVKTNTQLTIIRAPLPPQPAVTGLLAAYCNNQSIQKGKITNLPAAASGITVTAKLDASSLTIASDSTFSFDLSTLGAGSHTIAVSFTNASGTKTFSQSFSNTLAITPDVNVNANITNVISLATPVIITSTNAIAGGTAPLYTFAKNRTFTTIVQAEGASNVLNLDPATLAIGDNWIYVRMKSNASCITTQSVTDSIKIVRDQATGITDPDNPGKVINIYPNPFNKQLYISGLSSGKTYTLYLTNLNGQLLQQKRITNRTNAELILQKEKAGTYLLSVYDDKKKVLLGSVKIVKQ